MIEVNCEQGTPEWLYERLGRPTASNFHKIITSAKGEPSKQMYGYGYQLLAEQILGHATEDVSSGFMERGKTFEQQARDWYAFEREVTVEKVGFLLRDDERVGCSPDGLVKSIKDGRGGVEIKVPNAKNHIEYLLSGPGTDYKCQCQGSMWIAETDWWDFVSYNPELPSYVERFYRDDVFIQKLSNAVDELLEFVDKNRKRLIALGCVPKLDNMKAAA